MVDLKPARSGRWLLAGVVACSVLLQTAWAQDAGAANNGNTPGKIKVPLTGTAMIQRIDSLAVTPSTFDTGLIEIGDSRTTAVTIAHTGTVGADSIVINAATIFGKNANEYSTGFNGFITLHSGDTIDVDVLFTPMIPGSKSAGLRLDIEGATSPYILLFNGRSRYPLTSDLGTSDQMVEFGQINEGKTATRNFELTNQGDAEAPVINISAVQLSGDQPGAFNVDFTPVQLAPGEQADVTVIMTSPDAGFKSAEIEVVHDGFNPALEMRFEGNVVKPAAVPVNFSNSILKNVIIDRPTSLQFGPDGKLYVAEHYGLIHVFSVVRNGKNNYTANKLETINLIKSVPNHNDDGSLNPAENKRQLTAIYVTGTAAQPVIYAASSDPRMGGGPSATNDKNVDTNSGILHKLTKTGGTWVKQDLVRGLPRSEENHAPNGLLLTGNKLMLLTGGHTNQGAPSHNFVQLPEYALSGALLEIDLAAIGSSTHDLPTLDDEDRPGVNDANDPFGGNNGKNQAKLVQNGPVKIYSTGFRNAYDLVLTEAGKLYTFDNGSNSGWGGTPPAGCSNQIVNAGQTNPDSLHLLSQGYYAGHPNPTRGNKANTFNTSNPQTPVEGPADPAQCTFKNSGSGSGALTTIAESTNGLDEYTASNFGGAMQGDLLTVSWLQKLWRLQLNGAGNQVTSKSVLATTTAGGTPLDLTAQGDTDVFPGTIWLADLSKSSITVYEPADF